ncbi:TPA: hypothetical protein N0F65_010620 [Lagenidium giganteum]|uniref:Uncharacterized protein n=1 Tax=Lagenidium giganteum TaxID=4803 RepID=A0AAV2ZB23_9STRA|nr:TPA: hypothetical protein N0F65_010620 [Lagenidium giganteum]
MRSVQVQPTGSARDGFTTSATALFARLRDARTLVWDHAIRLSWFRVVASIASYTLLCSDIARGGLGVRSLRDRTPLEPNLFQFSGPWSYPVSHIRANETATGDPVEAWTYKFDTTSASWRSFAQFYNASQFPPCVLYRSDCVDGTLELSQVFSMADQLVNLTIAHGLGMLPRGDAFAVALRTTSLFRDRLHDHVLPQVFNQHWKKLVQSVYYSPRVLGAVRDFDVCSMKGARPFLCQELWLNFKRSCSLVGSDEFSCATGQLPINVRERYRALEAQYPGAYVDLTVISSSEIVDHNTGGIGFEAYRDYEMTTLMRVLQCPQTVPAPPIAANVSQCVTIAVDDYRYEGTYFINDIPDWYGIVSKLRFIAQAYFFVRLALLFGGCYVARRQETKYKNEDVFKVIQATLTTIAKMPCQGIVYGSPLPVVCYVVAHVIDAPLTYRIVAERFTTWDGTAVTFDFWEAMTITAVQMRNLWVLAFILQALVWNRTRRQWKSSDGVIGFPEYALSILSSISILAQYRSTSFRSSHVLTVQEAPGDLKKLAAVHSIHYDRGTGSVAWEGLWIDVKCLLVLFFFAMVLTLLLWLVLSWCRGAPQHRIGILYSHTPVPYSAGVLWPPAAFSIYWNARLFPSCPATQPRTAGSGCCQRIDQVIAQGKSRVASLRSPVALNNVCADWPTAPLKRVAFAWDQMTHAHVRRDDGHAVVALMNLFAMTDPWSFFWLRVVGYDVCVVRDRVTGGMCCLPRATVNDKASCELPLHTFDIVHETNSKSMAWSDLLHCG